MMDRSNSYKLDLTESITDKSLKQKTNEPSGWTWPLVLAGITSCFGLCVPVGYTLGNVNNPSFILRPWTNESIFMHYGSALDEVQLDILWSTIVSVFLIGGMTGSLGGGWMADKLGRKGALVLSGILQVISACLFFATKPCNSVEMFLAARIISGLASGLATAVVPMYLMELSPDSVKGAMGVICPLGVTLGVFVGQVVGLPFLLGTETLWNYLLSFYIILVGASSCTLPWLPESPKYLWSVKMDGEGAIKVLSFIRRKPEGSVAWELQDSKSDGIKQAESWSVIRLLSTPSMYLNLALVCALQAGQQFSGINAVFYYSVDIFMSAGLSRTSAQYATLGAGLINFISSVIMIPFVNNLPRRLLSITSCSFAVAALLMLTLCMQFTDDVTWLSYVSIVAVLAYIIFYAMGLGPIPYFIGSELFDVGPRPPAMALGSVANWTGNFLVGMSFPSVQKAIGPYSFLVCATFTSLLCMFLIFCLPETNAKVLEKIENQRRRKSLNSENRIIA